jgi:GT2 family glycosyltransferase
MRVCILVFGAGRCALIPTEHDAAKFAGRLRPLQYNNLLSCASRVQNPKLLIVTATRVAPSPFVEGTPLGSSMRRLSFDRRLEARPSFNNRAGLPVVYNRQISEENREKFLLFVHDDVWIDDCFLYDRVREALQVFDVVGLAGNTRRLPGQPAWGFASADPFIPEDRRYLSGVVADGERPWGKPSRYGPPGLECRMLDGVFLAARCRTLLDSNVRFDERFGFDFYDIDFCRTVESAGLRMGTWPIAITHASIGKFGSPAWRAALEAYRRKWKD